MRIQLGPLSRLKLGPVARISLGLVSLASCLLLTADLILGMLPDESLRRAANSQEVEREPGDSARRRWRRTTTWRRQDERCTL